MSGSLGFPAHYLHVYSLVSKMDNFLFFFLFSLTVMENGVRGNEYTLLNTQEIYWLLCWIHSSHTLLMGPCQERLSGGERCRLYICKWPE